jgi:hypothetical protein
MSSPGDDFRDHIAGLLNTRYDAVRTEVQLTGKKADIRFDVRLGPSQRIPVAAECKKWNRALTRDDVGDIIRDYDAAYQKREIEQLWIVCDRTPAAGARDYVSGFRHCQIMTGTECEQSIVDFQPLLTFLVDDYATDRVATYYIPPSFEQADGRTDLDSYVTAQLDSDAPMPIAIWAGYGMGKTTYARYLARTLALKCQKDYASRIPVLLSLGEFTTAPNLETLIVTQLTNHYGVRYLSAAAFRLLNKRHRFVLILDGFDEMKFAMAPNEFNFISAQMRQAAAVNPRLLLLGRPDSIESDDEQKRLTSSKLVVQDMPIRADDGPEFKSLRLSFLARADYLHLIRNFLQHDADRQPRRRALDDIIASIEKVDLGDILARPVQAKMLAEVVADPEFDISKISRFSLYALFIQKVLRREEEKAVRRHLGTPQRMHFMRLLAWWLWTEKKTRTFAANEIPIELVQKFQLPGVALEGLRRELLIGSILEEKNIGHFLAEKDAGVFYFPHTSFTEFLVADYIMSTDFNSTDVSKVPDALYGEVPTFLGEHSSGDAILSVYKRMKAARIAMSTGCLSVLLNDFNTRMDVELVQPSSADPWDICLHYFFLRAAGRLPTVIRQFLLNCLESDRPTNQLAAFYCSMYEYVLAPEAADPTIANAVLQMFRGVDFEVLFSARARGQSDARTSAANHSAFVISTSIRISRDRAVLLDFNEFTTATLPYMGTSCVVSDVIERMPSMFRIPENNLLAAASDPRERASIIDLLSKETDFKIIPSM